MHLLHYKNWHSPSYVYQMVFKPKMQRKKFT